MVEKTLLLITSLQYYRILQKMNNQKIQSKIQNIRHAERQWLRLEKAAQ